MIQEQQPIAMNVCHTYLDEGGIDDYGNGSWSLLDMAALVIMATGMLLYYNFAKMSGGACAMGYVPLIFAYALMVLMDRVFEPHKGICAVFKALMLVYSVLHAFLGGAAAGNLDSTAYYSNVCVLVILFLAYMGINRLLYMKFRMCGEIWILSQIRMSGEKGIRNTVIVMILEIIMADVFILGYSHGDSSSVLTQILILLVMDLFIMVPHIAGIVVQKLSATRAVSRKLQWMNHFFVCSFTFLILYFGSNGVNGNNFMVGLILLYVAAFMGCIICHRLRERASGK